VTVSGVTVNRPYGSSLNAIMTASRLMETGDTEMVIARGAESMTRAPWVLCTLIAVLQEGGERSGDAAIRIGVEQGLAVVLENSA
jgi:acetyl-CoA acetyltransferase